MPSSEALIGLYARRRTATSILLRGIEGSGRQQPRVGRSLPRAAESALTAIAVDTRANIEAVLDETLRLARPRLVTIERARLLSGEIEPVRLGEEPGDATRLTVYCRQRDRAYQMPAFEAACELLYRGGSPAPPCCPASTAPTPGTPGRGTASSSAATPTFLSWWSPSAPGIGSRCCFRSSAPCSAAR